MFGKSISPWPMSKTSEFMMGMAATRNTMHVIVRSRLSTSVTMTMAHFVCQLPVSAALVSARGGERPGGCR